MTSTVQPPILAAAVARLGLLVSTLRDTGLSIPPEKHVDFLAALRESEMLDLGELYWVARVTLVSTATDLGLFDAVFDAWAFGAAIDDSESASDPIEQSSETRAPGEPDQQEMSSIDLGEGSGRDPAADELVGRRSFPTTPSETQMLCDEIRNAAVGAIPVERSRRLRPAPTGRVLDVRRILRTATRTGGEVQRLAYRTPPRRRRRVLVLVDISGSMKADSADYLRFAHALVAALDRIEVFSFGTRLTRVTEPLRQRDVDAALGALSDVVFDIDGGTRIGASIEEFLGDTRNLAMARGALVIIVSDGLECGSPDRMTKGVERLARLAHRLVWLTPLAADPDFRPATRAMMAVENHLDRLGSAGSLEDLLAETSHLPAVSSARRGATSRQRTYRIAPIRTRSRRREMSA